MSSRSSCSEICSALAGLRDREAAALAAGGDQHGGERDEAGEALGADRGLLARAARRLGVLGVVGAGRAALGDARERLAAVALDDRVEPLARLGGELGRADDAGVLAVAERPRDHAAAGSRRPCGRRGRRRPRRRPSRRRGRSCARRARRCGPRPRSRPCRRCRRAATGCGWRTTRGSKSGGRWKSCSALVA